VLELEDRRPTRGAAPAAGGVELQGFAAALAGDGGQAVVGGPHHQAGDLLLADQAGGGHAHTVAALGGIFLLGGALAPAAVGDDEDFGLGRHHFHADHLVVVLAGFDAHHAGGRKAHRAHFFFTEPDAAAEGGHQQQFVGAGGKQGRDHAIAFSHVDDVVDLR